MSSMKVYIAGKNIYEWESPAVIAAEAVTG